MEKGGEERLGKKEGHKRWAVLKNTNAGGKKKKRWGRVGDTLL